MYLALLQRYIHASEGIFGDVVSCNIGEIGVFTFYPTGKWRR